MNESGVLRIDGRVGFVGVKPPLRCPELERERGKPLLGAVVQVAFDSLSLLVRGRHDPDARFLDLFELRSSLGLQLGVLER